MRYITTLIALALAGCASTPPPRAAKPVAQESLWEDAALGATLGLLVMGVAWNFMDVPKRSRSVVRPPEPENGGPYPDIKPDGGPK